MKTYGSILALLALGQSPHALAINETEALYSHALKLMSDSPLIDTHVDLPQIIRGLGMVQVSHGRIYSQMQAATRSMSSRTWP